MSQSAKQIAVGLLARRDHSRQELQIKLTQKQFDAKDIISALDYCESHGFQDDVRFAGMLVRSHINKGHGPARVQQALVQKGLSRELISQALDTCDCDWFALALKKANKKYGNKPIEDHKDRAKRVRYLMGQGFSYDQIAHALDYDPYDEFD